MREIQAKKLGEAIRKARKVKGLSASALAEVIGVHYSTMSYLERGMINKPNIKMLKAISRELAIPLDDLFALSGYAREQETLPALPIYLRSKYGLSPREITEIEEHFRKLTARKSSRKKGS